VPAGDDARAFDAEQPEQQVVARRVGAEAARDALLEDQAALHPLAHRRRRRQPAVVRLHRTHGDERVRALRERVGDQELELAGLVAAGGEPEQVVAFDPELGCVAAELVGSTRDRCGIGSSGVGPAV
jgi:hypothetical protein